MTVESGPARAHFAPAEGPHRMRANHIAGFRYLQNL